MLLQQLIHSTQDTNLRTARLMLHCIPIWPMTWRDCTCMCNNNSGLAYKYPPKLLIACLSKANFLLMKPLLATVGLSKQSTWFAIVLEVENLSVLSVLNDTAMQCTVQFYSNLKIIEYNQIPSLSYVHLEVLYIAQFKYTLLLSSSKVKGPNKN